VTYHSTRLEATHKLEAFDCGVESLNRWLLLEAMRAQKADTARTYVWTQTDDDHEVLAYFSIAPTGIIRHEVSSGQAGGQSGFIPAYLLGRLALDIRLQGQGLATELLIDALGRIIGASEITAGRLIIVDAIDDRAKTFYTKRGFTPVKTRPNRLAIKVSTVRRLFGLG
jgi:GNAT superfamily N-acetyltransferase